MKTLAFTTPNLLEIAKSIKAGEISVLPTDTLYGLSCTAFNNASVERIYQLKQRESDKPFIILIPDISALVNFGIALDMPTQAKLAQLWPAKLTVVFDCNNPKFEYLHRGKKSLGFRIPAYPPLLELLKLTGPLTSTTVNISGEKPAETIAEARALFGENVALYADAGALQSEPSTVARLVNGSLEVLRQGSFKLS